MNLKVYLLAIAAASVAAQSSSGSDAGPPLTPADLVKKPGLCKKTDDCKKFGEGYSCVAVETTIQKGTMAMQCVKGQVCGGTIAGACPTFSSWPAEYRPVQPVCAFDGATVTNCDNALDMNGNQVAVRGLRADAAKKGNVTCFSTEFSNESQTKKVNGIYRCVDKGIYESKNLGYLDFTAKQMKSCAGNVTVQSNGVSATTGLCNAHGTCAPKNMFSSDYGCICAKGYSANDNCLVPTSDVCDSFGQCGSGNCDPKTGKCVCPEGSKGPQCNLCDPTYTGDATKICSGRGKCGIDNTCQCEEGYLGDNCSMKPAKTPAPKSNSTDDSTPATSSADQASVAALGLATMVVAALL